MHLSLADEQDVVLLVQSDIRASAEVWNERVHEAEGAGYGHRGNEEHHPPNPTVTLIGSQGVKASNAQGEPSKHGKCAGDWLNRKRNHLRQYRPAPAHPQ